MARSTPLVLTTAHSGAAYHPQRYCHIPTTVDSFVQDVRESMEAGSGFAHIHALDPSTGLQFADLNWYDTLKRRLQNEVDPELAVGFPTSRKGRVEFQIEEALRAFQGPGSRPTTDQIVEAELVRAVAVNARPNSITSFAAPEILAARRELLAEQVEASLVGYSSSVRWRDPEVVRAYYRRLRELSNQLGVRQELEVTTSVAFAAIDDIADDPTMGLDRTIHVVILLGFSNRLPIHRNSYESALAWVNALRQRTGVTAVISVGAVIPPHKAALSPTGSGHTGDTHDYREVLEWVVEDDRVDAFRVGLEDTPVMYGEHRSNAWLVRHVREIAETSGVTIEATPGLARSRLQM